jgi:hypothetical protein
VSLPDAISRNADLIRSGFNIRNAQEDTHFRLGIADGLESSVRIWPSVAAQSDSRLDWAYRTGLEVGRAMRKEPK